MMPPILPTRGICTCQRGIAGHWKRSVQTGKLLPHSKPITLLTNYYFELFLNEKFDSSSWSTSITHNQKQNSLVQVRQLQHTTSEHARRNNITVTRAFHRSFVSAIVTVQYIQPTTFLTSYWSQFQLKQKDKEFWIAKMEYKEFNWTDSWLTLTVRACSFVVTDGLKSHADRSTVVACWVGYLHNYQFFLPAIVSDMT